MSPLTEYLEQANSATENRREITRGCGGWGGGGSYCLMTSFIYDDETIFSIDSGDGYTTL